jgi:Leucine-rich repeat (LRR) protein
MQDEKIECISLEIIEEILSEYPRIQSLDFSHNSLTKIENLEKARNTLLALNVSFNHIDFTFSSGCLPQLTNLVQLDLSNNCITVLKPSGINKLQNLNQLDLSHNLLSSIDEVLYLQGNDSLRILSISNNKFFGGIRNIVLSVL